MTEPVWLDFRDALAIHSRLLAEHGGAAGVRDQGLLESALARPRQVYAYGEGPDLAALAAAYTLGILRNHPFVDGNKRVALVLTELFLALNGTDLLADDVACVTHTLQLADGALTEAAFAEWLRMNCTKD